MLISDTNYEENGILEMDCSWILDYAASSAEENGILELDRSWILDYAAPSAEDPVPTEEEPGIELPEFDGRQACLVEPHAYYEAERRAIARGTDEVSRTLAQAFKEYSSLAELKNFAQAPDHISALFSKLRAEFPNFVPFIREMEGLCSRAALRPRRDIPPINILLVGPPGLGKTSVTRAIASALGTSHHEISMNGSGAAFELRGLSRFWRGSSPGRVAKCFNESQYANPVILLDEIDKAAKEVGHARAIDTLLDLTERITSKSFRDDCLELEIDASHALFIATANDLRCIPDALLSRFVVVEVTAPSREQMMSIVRKMYKEMIAAEGDVFAEELPEEVATRLALCVPREASSRLAGAINAAAIRVLAAEGGPRKGVTLVVSDLAGTAMRAPRIFGFVPTNE